MKHLIVAGTVLAFLFLCLMLSKTNKNLADKFLILYLAFTTFNQVYLYFETHIIVQNSSLMLLGKGKYLLNAPLFFLYIYALLKTKKPSFILYGMMLSPFFAYFFHFLYYYFFVFDQAAVEIRDGLIFINGDISVSWLIFVILFLLFEPLFLIWFYILLKEYKKRMLESVSDTKRIQINWLHLLFYISLIISVILVPISIVAISTESVSTELLEIMIQTAYVVFFFVIGYYGFKQTTVFTNLELKDGSHQKSTVRQYERSGLSSKQAEEYHTKLLELMEEDKPYLHGELKANELAMQLGVSVNHLSQVLNEIQKQNFFDFVNSYRIKEVIQKMNDSPKSNLTLLAFALDSGFNSKTSFNTVFKKVMHQTPSAYYKSLK
jgi:AraC-like DNA-binding protein